MKKALLLLLIFIIVGIGLAPYVDGQLFKRILLRNLAIYQHQQKNAHSGIRVEVTEYQSGWITSTAKLKITIQPTKSGLSSQLKPVVLNMNAIIQHGPVIYADSKLTYAFANIQTTIQPPAALKKLATNSKKGFMQVNLSLLLDAKTWKVDYDMPALSQASIGKWEGLNGSAIIKTHGDMPVNVEGNIKLGKLMTSDKQSSLLLSPTEIKFKALRSQTSPWQLEVKATTPSVEKSWSKDETMKIGDITESLKTGFSDNTYHYITEAKVDRVNFKSSSPLTEMSHLEFSNDIHHSFKKDASSFNTATFLSFDSNLGKGSAEIRLSVNPIPKLASDITSAINASINLSAATSFIDNALASYYQAVTPASDLDTTDASDLARATIESLVDEGYITRNDSDEYALHFTKKGDSMVLNNVDISSDSEGSLQLIQEALKDKAGNKITTENMSLLSLGAYIDGYLYKKHFLHLIEKNKELLANQGIKVKALTYTQGIHESTAKLVITFLPDFYAEPSANIPSIMTIDTVIHHGPLLYIDDNITLGYAYIKGMIEIPDDLKKYLKSPNRYIITSNTFVSLDGRTSNTNIKVLPIVYEDKVIFDGATGEFFAETLNDGIHKIKAEINTGQIQVTDLSEMLVHADIKPSKLIYQFDKQTSKDWVSSTSFTIDDITLKSKDAGTLVLKKIVTNQSSNLVDGIDNYEFTQTVGDLRFNEHHATDLKYAIKVTDIKYSDNQEQLAKLTTDHKGKNSLTLSETEKKELYTLLTSMLTPTSSIAYSVSGKYNDEPAEIKLKLTLDKIPADDEQDIINNINVDLEASTVKKLADKLAPRQYIDMAVKEGYVTSKDDLYVLNFVKKGTTYTLNETDISPMMSQLIAMATQQQAGGMPGEYPVEIQPKSNDNLSPTITQTPLTSPNTGVSGSTTTRTNAPTSQPGFAFPSPEKKSPSVATTKPAKVIKKAPSTAKPSTAARKVLASIKAIRVAANEVASQQGSYASGDSVLRQITRSSKKGSSVLKTPWKTTIYIDDVTASSYTIVIPDMPAAVCSLVTKTLRRAGPHYYIEHACNSDAADDFIYTYTKNKTRPNY